MMFWHFDVLEVLVFAEWFYAKRRWLFGSFECVAVHSLSD